MRIARSGVTIQYDIRLISRLAKMVRFWTGMIHSPDSREPDISRQINRIFLYEFSHIVHSSGLYSFDRFDVGRPCTKSVSWPNGRTGQPSRHEPVQDRTGWWRGL